MLEGEKGENKTGIQYAKACSPLISFNLELEFILDSHTLCLTRGALSPDAICSIFLFTGTKIRRR